jgi:precorrin-2 methylase
MLNEEITIKFNQMELLDIEKALNLLIETEGDSVFYSALTKIKEHLN